jgi:hypothetical protein
MMLVLVISLCIGCGTVFEQENSKNYTQNQDIITEHQTETESLYDNDSDFAENEMSQDNDTSQSENVQVSDKETQVPEDDVGLDEDGSYTSKDEVAAYIHQYGRLPSNFITKKEAKKLGWISIEGNLGEVAPGKSIGGDYFGNYEELLPEKDGRDYYECDINTDGSYRGAERIVFSNDGLIYYTSDHYETFELLYGEE